MARASVDRRVEGGHERLERARPSDERRVEPEGAAVRAWDERDDTERVSTPVELLGLDRGSNQPARPLPEDDLPRAGVGGKAPARRDRTTGRDRILRDEHLARVDPGTGLQEDAALGDQLVVQVGDRLPHLDRRTNGAKRVVLVHGRDAENRDEVVGSREACGRPPVPLHGGPNGREVAIEHGPEQLGIEAPELTVGVDDARDEHGHDLARGPRRRHRQLDRLPCALDAGRRAERLVLSEDRLLELPELVGGIDPELLDEHPADVLVRLERLGLPAAAVQREHQLRAGPLPVRLGRDERLEVGDNVEVPPERELRVDELLPRRELQLLEPRDLRARERLERQIGERRPAEERQCIPQLLGALGRWSVAALHDLPLEAHGVDLLGREVERIAGGQRRNRLAAELLSQLRHVVLERVGRAAGRLLPPEILDERVLGNRPPDPQRECREQGARFLAVRRQDLLAVDDVELTEQSDLEHAAFYHGRRIPGRDGLPPMPSASIMRAGCERTLSCRSPSGSPCSSSELRAPATVRRRRSTGRSRSPARATAATTSTR